VSVSPLEELLGAVDRLEPDAVMALFGPECSFTTADGRCAEGRDAVRSLLAEFVGALRSMTHAVTGHWQQDDVWIAEVLATYVLQDWGEVRDRRRAFFIRSGPAGISDVRVYGAHEHQLGEHAAAERGVRVSGRWFPPL
jgi:hypothetical protein